LRHEKLHLDVEQVAWREQLSVQTVFADEHESQPSVFRFISDAARDVPDKRVETMLKEDAAALIPFEEARKTFERDYLVRLLKITGGNVTQAAQLAKRNRTEFYKLLQRHGIEASLFKDARTETK
jgi:DNA-binding NtrC family response regulator